MYKYHVGHCGFASLRDAKRKQAEWPTQPGPDILAVRYNYDSDGKPVVDYVKVNSRGRE